MRATLFLILIGVGCRPAAEPVGVSPPSAPEPDAPSAAATSAASAEPVSEAPLTRYQVGDWVTYRYSGHFSEEPVTLREEIIEQKGPKLRIRITIERGGEKRRFDQVVTDTPENRENNVVDELYELDGDTPRKLEPSGKELVRLYAWTLPPCEGKQSGSEKEDRSLELAGARFECTCRGFEQTCRGQAHHGSSCDCPRFLWTHASGSLRSVEDDEELWRVEVEDFGPRR